jgi:hypothetical protein
MSEPVWRRTDLTRNLIRCDLCGAKAESVHFLSDGDYPGKSGDAVEAVFACPKHDAGGYHVEFDRWFDPGENFPQHIAQKFSGRGCRRVDQLSLRSDSA